MHAVRGVLAFIVAAAILVANGANVSADSLRHATSEYARVTSWVGSGLLGNHDGAALDASFIMPVGVAFEPNGTLLVTDAGAQNIRAIDRTGTVRTIAGPTRPSGDVVTGGYADGPVSQARFDGPSGIAIGPNGDIYVADTGNRCIRRIAGGMVTTLAGSPGLLTGPLYYTPASDGSSAKATFLHPFGIASDDAGNLYVADDGIGARRIDAATHEVSTLPLDPLMSGTHLTGISFARGPSEERSLYMADGAGLTVYDLTANTRFRFETTTLVRYPAVAESAADSGFPFAVAGINAREAAFVDMRQGAVYYVHSRYVRRIAGAETADATNYGGGWRDGVGPTARFNVPMGIAHAADGRIAVADSGNRMIRLIDKIDRRYYVGPGREENYYAYAPGRSDFGIGLIGSSLTWNDTVWGESVANVAQRTLTQSSRWRSAGLSPPHFVPITLPGATLDATLSYINSFVINLNIRCLVYDVDGAVITEEGKYDPVKDPQFTAAVVDKFRKLKRTLAEHHIALVLVYMPLSTEVSPTEAPVFNLLQRYQFADRITQLRAERKVLTSALAGVGWFADATPAFQREAAAPHPLPLFATSEGHPSVFGRNVAGRFVAATLEQYAKDLKRGAP